MRIALSISLAASIAVSPVAAQAQETLPSSTENAPDGRDDVQMVEIGDPEISAAIAMAKRTTPAFLTALDNPDSFNITFKYPLGGYEHIWVNNVRRDGIFLTGNLDNVPIQTDWKRGDAVRVPIADVSDYFYCDADGAPHGHFTTIVFIDRAQGAGYTAKVLPQLCEVRVETGRE